MLGFPESAYTVTLDDDAIFHKLIERLTRVRTQGFTKAEEMLSSLNSESKPIAFFIDNDLADGRYGLDLIPELRKIFPYTPILAITGNTDPYLIAKAIRLGADDFIRKPLEPTEVVARLQARIQSLALQATRDELVFEDLVINMRTRTLRAGTKVLRPSPIDEAILVLLARHKGILVEKSLLVREVWGLSKVSESALHRKIHSVRQLLLDSGSDVVLETKHGKGFRLAKKTA